MIIDCAIIGGGPAGLNAALVLGRARRSIILFDNDQPRNAVTHESHGFITRDGVSPREFRDLAHHDIRKYPSVNIKKSNVLEINRESHSLFKLITDDGESYLSRKIMLAIGLKEKLPDVNGIRDYYGRSLFSCPYCDGWELKDQPLVLIGVNNNAPHLAKMIYQWSKDLVICTNGNSILSDTEMLLFKSKGIGIREERIAHLSGTDGKLKKVVFEDGRELNRTGGFVTPELEKPNDLADLLGCEMNKIGGIIIDALGRTNVEGVYAAGDISAGGPTQLIIAASQGSRAAMGINSDLTMEEFE
ncbi:pyridine nucleotide-disulfide oxidoreductase [Bacillus sp. SA1-12]|uniref:NAD(P)/FAD-dependent oxidoreductase n=1 Tax=Bacillus sp. SA1-12 TaxID=1455638 RepID=UPI000625F208|nr:NAD(P)/FAD-dependent oxidoreductase [Bacillus sp. SA1-12]KKI92910.1 pyridine nucleotide-disulfide oxidoreductase [Bacillus sp. SA1-12]